MNRKLATALMAALLASAGTPHAAEPFAAPGAKATLTVDYSYESTGRKSSPGMYDPYEWRVKRTMSLVVDLAAHLGADLADLVVEFGRFLRPGRGCPGLRPERDPLRGCPDRGHYGGNRRPDDQQRQ